MKRILLILEYHGKGFFGWQRQGPRRSVQATVEEALTRLVGHEVSLQASGRTDRGVHALAMPAHADLGTRLEPRDLLMALNHYLPSDVAVREVHEVDPRFHARFDACNKLYRYTMYQSRARSPLLGDRAYLLPRPVDVEAMQKAAALLVGTHDFGSFQTNPHEEESAKLAAVSVDTVGPAAVEYGAHEPPPWRTKRPDGTVRTIGRAEVLVRRNTLRLEIDGNGFLRGMVRALAGSLVEVGLGKQPPEWISELLETRDRRDAGANLPAHGLTLVRVDYPAEPFEGYESYNATDALQAEMSGLA